MFIVKVGLKVHDYVKLIQLIHLITLQNNVDLHYFYTLLT